MNILGGRWLPVLVAGAMLASTPVAHAKPNPFPEPGPQFPVVEPGQTRKATPAPPPTLNVSVQQDEVARAGGRGSVLIPITRTTKGPTVRDLKVSVQTAKGTTIRRITAPGWRCSTTTCRTRRATLPGNRSPEQLYAVIAIGKDYRKRTAKITATATWKGGAVQRSASSTKLHVYPRMTVSLRSTGGRRLTATTQTADAARQIHLAARVRNLAGGQADARWTQLSGPDTTFVQKARVRNVREQFAQVARISDSTRGTHTYRFGLRVDANGQVIRKTVRVTVRVHRALGKVAGNNQALTDLAAKSRKPDRMRSKKTTVSNGVRLRAKPSFTVRPGAFTRVRVVTDRRVKSIAWFVGGQQVGTGRSVRVRAPGTPHSARIVRAQVVLNDGKGLLESALVRANGTLRESFGTPTDADLKTFCALSDAAAKAGAFPKDLTVPLGDAYTLVMPPKSITQNGATPKKCTGDATLAYEKATLKRGTATIISDVSGKVTLADGIAISKASWVIPDSLKPANAKSVGMGSLSQQDKPVVSALQDGKWVLPEGTLAVAPITVGTAKVYGLQFIPLPGDWSFDTGKTLLSFVNANADEPEVKDATVRFSQTASGPQDASAVFTVDSTSAQWETAKLDVANLALGQTAQGDTIAASGSATLPLSKDNSGVAELSVQCLRQGQPSSTCELAKGFVIKGFTLKWGKNGLGLLGEAGVKYGTPEQTYEFGVRGAYKGPRDWSLDAVSPAAWDLGTSGVQLTNLLGSVGMRPLDKQPTKSQLVAQFTGKLVGLNVGSDIKVNSLTGAITNLCPQDAQDCTTGQIRVALSADLAAQLPDKDTPVPLRAGAYLNLTTMTFEFDFTAEDIEIGPKDLKVTKAQFILTDENRGSCTQQGISAPAAPPRTYLLQIRAQATVLGAEITVGGSATKNGYCLWGRPGTIDAGASGKTTSQVFGFTTYPNGADLRLPTGEDQILTQNTMRIFGTYQLPDKVRKTFNIDGDVAYKAEYTVESTALTFAMTYTPQTPAVLYSSDTANLNLRQVSFSMSGSTASKEYSLTVGAKGSLFMKGANGVPDSTTPLYVAAALNLGPNTQVTFRAGVDNNGVALENAFGQPGLTVRQLNLAFSLNLTEPAASVALNADVTLPDSWVKSIGVQPGTREVLAFSLGGPKWCLDIELGEQSTANTKVAVDLANRGFLKANYFKVLIAPLGCSVPTSDGSKEIAPGYGFAFYGTIASAQVIASVNASFTDGLIIDGTLRVPELNLLFVKLGGSKAGTPAQVDLDINSKQGKYDVAFDVGLAIGAPERNIGAFVAVKGQLRTSDPDFIDFTLTGAGKVALGPIGMDVENLKLVGHIAKGDKAAQNRLAANATVSVHSLGMTMRAEMGLHYDHQQLIDLNLRAELSLNLVVGAVSGNVEFNYCLGRLSDLKEDGSGSKCTPFTKYEGAAPAYRVGFFGSYRIAWWSHGYAWTVYNQDGVEGREPAPKPDDKPKVVDGTIPPVPFTLNELRVDTDQVKAHAEVSWDARNTYIKAEFGNGSDGLPACRTADLGSRWTASTANPAPESVNPDPSTAACNLVAVAKVAGKTEFPVNIKCTATECTVLNFSLAGQVLGEDGPNGAKRRETRDRLIAGLRSPLGVLGAGNRMTQGTPLTSMGASAVLKVTAEGLSLTSQGKQVWSAWVPTRRTSAAMELTKKGLLQVYDTSGEPLFAVGTAAPIADTDKFPPYLALSADELSVQQRDTKGALVTVWSVRLKTGECAPRPDACAVKPL